MMFGQSGNGMAASPFLSWFMGGFECSTHHRADGIRLDLVAATGDPPRAVFAPLAQLIGAGVAA